MEDRAKKSNLIKEFLADIRGYVKNKSLVSRVDYIEKLLENESYAVQVSLYGYYLTDSEAEFNSKDPGALWLDENPIKTIRFGVDIIRDVRTLEIKHETPLIYDDNSNWYDLSLVVKKDQVGDILNYISCRYTEFDAAYRKLQPETGAESDVTKAIPK